MENQYCSSVDGGLSTVDPYIMTIDRYQLNASTDFLEFKFLSVGPRGVIKKMVRFAKMEAADETLEIYNLSFGDYNGSVENMIDDLVVSDNKDPQKIMATVAEAVITFTNNRPGAFVFAQGSTPARARYYVMGVAANLNELRKSFEIWGTIDGEWELFQPNSRYQALLARRK